MKQRPHSLAVVCPQLLHKIISELLMGSSVLDLFVDLNESFEAVFIPMDRPAPPHALLLIAHHMSTLVLSDHIVHDHTCCHDHPEHLLLPESSRVTHNSKSGLQHPKCPLHILPSIYLSPHKVMFVLNWGFDIGFKNVAHAGYIPFAR